MEYSNPRLEAEIYDWPSGSYKTKAIFKIEVTSRGERGTRVTLHPLTGKPAAPKKLTYATKARIVDGDDGRTYIAEWSGLYGFVTIMRGDMKLQHETIFEKDERFNKAKELFA